MCDDPVEVPAQVAILPSGKESRERPDPGTAELDEAVSHVGPDGIDQAGAVCQSVRVAEQPEASAAIGRSEKPTARQKWSGRSGATLTAAQITS